MNNIISRLIAGLEPRFTAAEVIPSLPIQKTKRVSEPVPTDADGVTPDADDTEEEVKT